MKIGKSLNVLHYNGNYIYDRLYHMIKFHHINNAYSYLQYFDKFIEFDNRLADELDDLYSTLAFAFDDEFDGFAFNEKIIQYI